MTQRSHLTQSTSAPQQRCATATHRQRVEQAVAAERELALKLAAAKEHTHATIVEALAAGATYRSVGHLLGVQGSTVLRRYGAKNVHTGASALDQPIGAQR